MSTDARTDEDNGPVADVASDCSRPELIEIVPLTRDTDDPNTTQCDSADCSEMAPSARDADGPCIMDSGNSSSSTSSVSTEVMESTSPAAEMTDDSFRLNFIEIIPLTGSTDGPSTTERNCLDWSAESNHVELSAVKQEPQDVCVCFILFGTTFVMGICFLS